MHPFSLFERLLKSQFNLDPDGMALNLLIDFPIIFQQLDGQPSRVEAVQLLLTSEYCSNFFNRCFEPGAEKELVFANRYILACNPDDMVKQCIQSDTFFCRCWNNMTAEQLLQLLYLNDDPFLLNFIDHIEGNEKINLQLHELCGQQQVALKVWPFENVDHNIRRLFDKIFASDNLLRRIWSERVDAWQVNYCDSVPLVVEIAFMLFNGDTRKISNFLMSAGESIEKRGLPAVWITCKRDAYLILFIHVYSVPLSGCSRTKMPSASFFLKARWSPLKKISIGSPSGATLTTLNLVPLISPISIILRLTAPSAFTAVTSASLPTFNSDNRIP